MLQLPLPIYQMHSAYETLHHAVLHQQLKRQILNQHPQPLSQLLNLNFSFVTYSFKSQSNGSCWWYDISFVNPGLIVISIVGTRTESVWLRCCCLRSRVFPVYHNVDLEGVVEVVKVAVVVVFNVCFLCVDKKSNSQSDVLNYGIDQECQRN